VRRAGKPGTAVSTALVTLLATALAGGCASEQEQYCEAVDEHQQELSEIALEPGQDGLVRALPIFEELADAAPSDVAADWDLVVTRVDALRQAFDDAGVDPATYDPEKPPEGVSRAERAAIREAVEDLVAEQSSAALASVEQHARDVCKTELGGAPLGG